MLSKKRITVQIKRKGREIKHHNHVKDSANPYSSIPKYY